jgi:hypothetical protein
MSVQEAQSKIPSSEFTDWKVYFDLEWDRVDKTDYYLAQLTSVIVQLKVSKPEKYGIDKFFFESKHKRSTYEKNRFAVDGMAKEEVTRLSKQKWLAILDPNGNKVK